MNKRSSKQFNQLSEKQTLDKTLGEEEYLKEKITKKSFSSFDKVNTTTTKIPTNDSVKQSGKMTLAELKNLRNLRKKQEVILLNIENNNIQKHVSNMLEKFNPPDCTNCTSRKADRICVNKACGRDKYMQIICGKCHLKEHELAVNKPEMDMEEYFIKLAIFLNETKHVSQDKKPQSLDIDNLEKVFDNLDLLRQKLASLRSKIEQQLESYSSPKEMHLLLQSSITKALSLCEYDNIQNQLLTVKKNVLFEKNNFLWNGDGEKYNSLLKIFKNLEDSESQIIQSISKSFIGSTEVDLNQLEVKSCFDGFGAVIPPKVFKGNDGEIKVETNSSTVNQQFYLDYHLEKDKKYKLRFRFQDQLTQYVMVGVMEKRQCSKTWMSAVHNQYFLKRFLCCFPDSECSRILKGKDVSSSTKPGQQIEMRIDFENNYVDFYDYPEMENVNASIIGNKFSKNEEYVIAILIFQDQTVIVESFSEIPVIEDIR